MASVLRVCPNSQTLPPQPPLAPGVRRILAGRASVDLRTLLFAPAGINPARATLMAALGLDAAAADFLAACTYWTLSQGGPFYKFNAPCSHPAYQEGDSWLEELGAGETAFYRARKQVATKNVSGSTLSELLRPGALTSLVLYWTDDTRRTWYEAQLDTLAMRLTQALGIPVTPFPTRSRPATAAPPTTPHPAPEPLPQAAPPTKDTPTPAGASSFPQNQGFLIKPPKPGVTYIQIKEEEGEQELLTTNVVRVARRLRAAGVYEEAAGAIAQQANARGLDADMVMACFQQHLQELQPRKGAAEALAIAVWRLQHGYWGQQQHHDGQTQQATTKRQTKANQAGGDHPARRRPGGARTELASARPTPPPPTPPTSPPDPTDRLWHQVLDHLRGQMSRATFEGLLHGSTAQRRGDQLVVQVTSERARHWLQARWQAPIEQLVTRLADGALTLCFEVRPVSPAPASAPAHSAPPAPLPFPARAPAHPAPSPPPDPAPDLARLWGQVVAQASLQLPRAVVERWLKDARLVAATGARWQVQVASPQAAEVLDHRLRPLLEQVAARVARHPIHLDILSGDTHDAPPPAR